MTKAVLERALPAEMTDELGYARDERPVRVRGTRVTATSPRPSPAANGPVTIDVPRDRNARVRATDRGGNAHGGSGQIDNMILSL